MDIDQDKNIPPKTYLFNEQSAYSYLGHIVSYFIPIFFIPIFIIGAISYYPYHYDIKTEIKLLEKQEILSITHLEDVISKDFRLISADLRYLAEQYIAHLTLQNPDPEALDLLSRDWLNFSAQKKTYDQIRFLDTNGMERVRINYNAGSPTITSKHDLQDKSQRYYVTEGLKQKKNDIYVSEFDLNIEDGQIELPYKPMTRFAIPVYGPDTIKRGIVVLNYLGGGLLNSLEKHSFSNKAVCMLLNQQGYWLKAENPDDEWGFMFADKKDTTFANRYPQAWEKIANNEQGQFYNRHGLFSYRTVHPFARHHEKPSTKQMNGQQNGWKIVSRIPQRQLSCTSFSDFLFSSLKKHTILLLFHFLTSLLLAKIIFQRKQTDTALKESEERLRTLINSTPDIVSFKDAHGRLLLVNTSYLNLFCLKNIRYKGKTVAELTEYSAVNQEAMLTGKETDNIAWESTTFHRSEESISFSSGRDLVLDVIKVPLFDEAGGRRALIVIGRDITEKKLAEEELKKQATVDMLTGTFNRRAGIIWLEKHMKLVQRTGSVVTICYVDINDLKLVNDTYGHDEGDRLIQAAVKTIQDFLRDSDITCRLGGDEFIIAFIDCDQARAMEVWQRIDQEFTSLNRKKIRPYNLSASYGFASFRGQDEEIKVEDFIALADKEMYQNKQAYKKQKWSQN